MSYHIYIYIIYIYIYHIYNFPPAVKFKTPVQFLCSALSFFEHSCSKKKTVQPHHLSCIAYPSPMRVPCALQPSGSAIRSTMRTSPSHQIAIISLSHARPVKSQ